MGGVLTHFSFSLIISLCIYLFFKISDKKELYLEKHLLKIDKSVGIKKIYHKIIYHKIFLLSLSFFVGHLIVDFFKFFFAGLVQKNWKIFYVNFDETFLFWANLTNNFLNWIFLSFSLFLIINYLYKKHFINKRNFFEFDLIVIFFLMGVLTHLIIDFFINETNVWF